MYLRPTTALLALATHRQGWEAQLARLSPNRHKVRNFVNSVRVSRASAIGLALVSCATGMTILNAPLAAGADTLTSDALVGYVLSTSGATLPGQYVSVFAEQPLPTAGSVPSDSEVTLTRLGGAVSGTDGRYSVSLDNTKLSNFTAKANADGGYLNALMVVGNGSSSQLRGITLSYSPPTSGGRKVTLGSQPKALSDTEVAAEDPTDTSPAPSGSSGDNDSPKASDPLNFNLNTSLVARASSAGDVSPNFNESVCSKRVADLGNQKAIVSQMWSTTGASWSGQATYTKGAVTELGLGFGVDGIYSQSGTWNRTATTSIAFAPISRFVGVRYYQSYFHWGKYHYWGCSGSRHDEIGYAALPEYYAGGSTYYNYKSSPWGKCLGQSYHDTFTADYQTAITWTNGVHLSANKVNVDLSTKSGHSTQTKVSFTPGAYHMSLCGQYKYPAQSDRFEIRGN